MASIDVTSASLAFPVYNTGGTSFRHALLSASTGGKLLKDARECITVNALNDINITLTDGDRLGLIGHNGAGKTTLLRLLAGIYTPVSGSVHVAGDISTLFNLSDGFNTELTGYDNIYLKGVIRGCSRQEIARLSKQIAEFTGLHDFLNLPVRTYSSGMAVRLYFAISAFIEPEILLIDEVFGAGDREFMEKAQKKMTSLIAEASIAVFATHMESLLKTLCNKAVLLEHGSIIAAGDVDSVLERYAERQRTKVIS